MKLARRAFLKNSVVVLALGNIIEFFDGCNLANALNEAVNILTLIAPLGDGIAAIIAVADPAIAPLVAAASAVYDKAVSGVEAILSDWAKASSAAQPAILSQAQALVVILQKDTATLIADAQVKDATVVAEISSITGAITNEISALLTIIPQIGALGGTTAVLKTPVAGTFKSRHLQLKGYRLAKDWRVTLVQRLTVPTGKTIDAPRAALAAKLSALALE